MAWAIPTNDNKSQGKYSGQATYFYPGLGACGWTNGDDDMIVAQSELLFKPNHGADCGRIVEITNVKKGNVATAKLVDECPGCSQGSLDMSPALFSKLNDGDLDAGVFNITWHFQS
ncbi:hypothetical protein M231_02658 [Tremella mesenterica]|uniref:Barwin domain-containing protein n=1 Tax=Tremella mesenterica TaxID=5217 RepID=A0A4Q1BQ23_TREME|nr:hypothetical protein M231_02658 [Tremella mesenterica]